ncbi:MAG: SDR family NAD(P)-dependent oxidoreductase [Lentisphaerales bacterium]|nr:SDR family NAD(P)-dependent oxidoreductase [Lentisphaerales bacterium]
MKRREFGQRVLICGAVSEADLLMRGCSKHFEGLFCGIVSHEEEFTKRELHGVQVHNDPLEEIGHLVKKKEITDIHILSPYNKPVGTNTIIDSCAKAGVSPNFHTIPSLKDMAQGDISASVIRDVEVTDLLGRVETDLPREKISDFVNSKKILITGAGGSIGSELSRQILGYNPDVLVLFEFSEVALYMIEKELHEIIKSSELKTRLVAFAGDIRHKEEVKQAIQLVNGIDVIYHAAAYKHVPLMEENVPSAFRNNVLGTARLAEVAEACGVKKFVMISSDKAVRPSNVMGATKRIAERVLQERLQTSTEFVAVRFGNVLGSSGSVIPLFKKQIREGKALTVTTKNMQRFFMTIPEAVDLVLMAGTVAKSSQIMVLEMGEPVKIYDLAVRLIELSGLAPHKDVNIEFCGLRPGEKEYEEILTEDENIIKTELDRIWLMQKDEDKQKGKPVNLELIEAMVMEHDELGLRKLIFDYVPENTFRKSSFSLEGNKPLISSNKS